MEESNQDLVYTQEIFLISKDGEPDLRESDLKDQRICLTLMKALFLYDMTQDMFSDLCDVPSD
jgi:hypothetical protein